MTHAHVLYDLDHHKEAVAVYWFCSAACQQAAKQEGQGEGINPDFIDGTIYEYCAKKLEEGNPE